MGRVNKQTPESRNDFKNELLGLARDFRRKEKANKHRSADSGSKNNNNNQPPNSDPPSAPPPKQYFGAPPRFIYEGMPQQPPLPIRFPQGTDKGTIINTITASILGATAQSNNTGYSYLSPDWMKNIASGGHGSSSSAPQQKPPQQQPPRKSSNQRPEWEMSAAAGWAASSGPPPPIQQLPPQSTFAPPNRPPPFANLRVPPPTYRGPSSFMDETRGFGGPPLSTSERRPPTHTDHPPQHPPPATGFSMMQVNNHPPSAQSSSAFEPPQPTPSFMPRPSTMTINELKKIKLTGPRNMQNNIVLGSPAKQQQAQQPPRVSPPPARPVKTRSWLLQRQKKLTRREERRRRRAGIFPPVKRLHDFEDSDEDPGAPTVFVPWSELSLTDDSEKDTRSDRSDVQFIEEIRREPTRPPMEQQNHQQQQQQYWGPPPAGQDEASRRLQEEAGWTRDLMSGLQRMPEWTNETAARAPMFAPQNTNPPAHWEPLTMYTNRVYEARQTELDRTIARAYQTNPQLQFPPNVNYNVVAGIEYERLMKLREEEARKAMELRMLEAQLRDLEERRRSEEEMIARREMDVQLEQQRLYEERRVGWMQERHRERSPPRNSRGGGGGRREPSPRFSPPTSRGGGPQEWQRGEPSSRPQPWRGDHRERHGSPDRRRHQGQGSSRDKERDAGKRRHEESYGYASDKRRRF